MKTINDRADVAEVALEAYRDANPDGEGESVEELLTDLLADLLHLAKREDVDVYRVLFMAQQHFEEET